MSVYTFWEAFAKLEKRLNEGQGGSTRGQPMHEVRSKLDKFLKTLALNGIQVCFCVLLCFCVEWLYSSTLPQHSSAFARNTQVKKLTLILICYHRNTECLHMIQSNLFLFFFVFSSSNQSSQLQNVWTEFKNRAFSRGGPGFSRE